MFVQHIKWSTEDKMARTLYAEDIGDAMLAAEVFGESPGLMVARPDRGCAPYLMIPHGYYALLTTNGAEINAPDGSCVWPSGFLLASPFTKIAHLVTKQFVVFDAPVKGCKTADNVTVQIDVSVVFRAPIYFWATFRCMPTANAEGRLESEGSVGKISGATRL